ncbi:hypothetical protein CHS0354_013310 [Potamilus streckersoni]|uniref:Uncharacterized protein n=1 Tax=Potamilus streckersoni TaxID=2493646 RepID=A0AAE0SA86_9BIVA|nr:hypothetical protein CHS0354_013310 [Potamilus streckersoni]
MSSSSGYLSESFSCKSDIDGTKRGKMENSEYAEFNDIGLKEMNPYDNKAEQMSTEESDRKVIRRRRCNYAISILSVAVLAGSCIVLCLFLGNDSQYELILTYHTTTVKDVYCSTYIT